jgi:hypothetical protein
MVGLPTHSPSGQISVEGSAAPIITRSVTIEA